MDDERPFTAAERMFFSERGTGSGKLTTHVPLMTSDELSLGSSCDSHIY